MGQPVTVSVSCSPSVRNGIPGKEGLFIISVTSGSLADKTGARVSYQAGKLSSTWERYEKNNNTLIEYWEMRFSRSVSKNFVFFLDW